MRRAVLLAVLVGACSDSGGTMTGDGGGSGSNAPLTDHERYLLGVWRGATNATDYSYMVLNDDRTGCGWDRIGEDFGRRYAKWTFTDWKLVESPLDNNGRMTIELRTPASSDVQNIERYAPPDEDRIFIAGIQPLTWRDILIPCSAAGSNATQTGVMRQGLMP